MAKLGYTWYPKDWGNSESVFELTLIERGLYRELIDMAMLSDNKTTYNAKVWARKFGSNEDEIEGILITLSNLKLIELKGDILFIPSCESRLNLVRGGKKSKPTTEAISNLKNQNTEPISEGTSEGTSEQIETKKKIKENEIENNTIVHSFLHLSINQTELDKLKEKYTEEDIFDCFDKIENYKDNKKYKSLYLTANIWLKKDYKEKSKEDDLPDDKKIDWKVFLDWFNDVINPDIKLKEVPQQTKNRYLNLLQSGFTKDHLINAILNGKKDNENLFDITIDTFSYSGMVSKYQKDVSKIGML
jgi:hypothetical protein